MNQHPQSLRTFASRSLIASLLTAIVFALVLAPKWSAQTAAKPSAAAKPAAAATPAATQKPSAATAQTAAPSLAVLHAAFANPPNEARPMVRWWWFGPTVVKPEILRELQQMKADGIQGAEMAFEYAEVLDDPAKDLKTLPFLSPEMLDDVAYAQAEGRKLGLRIDLTLGSGWPYGGPNTPLAEAITRIRVAQVAVPAGATSVTMPALAEGESLIAADIANTLATAPAPAAAPAVPAPAAPPAAAGARGGAAPGGAAGGAFGGRGGGGGGGGGGGRGGGAAAANYDATSAKPLTVSGNTASFSASDKPRTALFFVQGHTRMQVKRAAVGAEGFVIDHLSHDAVANYIHKVGEPLIGAFGSTPPYAIFSDSLEVGGSDWTPSLPAEFLKLRGYDLIPHLPELVAGGSVAADTVRHDYGETLTDLVDNNYLTQLTNFAVAHHTKFRSQSYGEPAVDFSSQNIASLAEGEGPQWRSFSTLRWATSANHVFDHPVTSGETFTWLHSPVFRAIPLDMKAEADIDFIMGENQIMCHGWPYSAPDNEVPEPGWSLYAAASFNNHNPWHPVMPAVTAYIGRMSYLLRQGKPANQVAILMPTDDAWATFAPGRTSVTGDMGRYVTPALMSAVLSAGYNVDFIDAKAINKVGLGTHQILILPNTERIPVETLKKIAAYVKTGGKAIAFGKLPTLTPEGKPLGDAGGDSSEIALAPDEASLAQALHNSARPDFQISATDDATLTHLGFIRRKLANADFYVVVNTGNLPIDTSATFATTHKFAEEWDIDNASVSAAKATAQAIHLDAYGSRVFVFSDTPSSAKAAGIPAKQLADLSSDWKVNFTGLNKSVTEATLTDWMADPSTLHYSGEGVYTRDFTLSAAPTGPVYLEVDGGKPETAPARATHLQAYYDPPVQAAALVTINGKAAGALWHPPYRLDVSKLLKPGANHIEIDVYNTALNAWSALPPHDYAPLIAKYGDKFQMQDLNLVAPVPSGLLGPVHLVTVESK
jgi:uncharacterized membrane protein YgcG